MSTFRRRAASAGAPCGSPEWRQSSHDAGLDVLAHALRVVVVVVVVVGAARRRVEGRDAVKVEHEVFPVAHRGVALVARDAHCRGTQVDITHVRLTHREDTDLSGNREE